MQRDLTYLVDMLDSAKLILGYVEGHSKSEFLREVSLQDQVARRLEIIGEAARNVSKEMKQELGMVPWREVIGLRNILIHAYGEVNYGRIWDTIQQDLPVLIDELEKHTSQRDQRH